MVALPQHETDVLTIREWAASVGVPKRTAQRWADEGRLDGSDANHPQAFKKDGRLYVAPHVYRVVEVESAKAPPAADAVTALVRAEIASHFERFAAQLRGEA